MGKISTYAIDGIPAVTDKVIGTDVGDSNITKNYTISDILGLATANTLQAVLDTGGTSTTPFFITTGSSYSEIDNLKLKSTGDLTLNGTLTDSAAVLGLETSYFGSTAGGATLWKARMSSIPATAASAGDKGDYAADGSFLYVCIASGSWVRTAVATW